jgi:DNA-binding XRE family transcriptional regulator
MDKKYTKREARELFGVKTDYQLAKVFGVSRQAMYAAGEDDELSEARQWQIRAMLAEQRSGQDAA